LGLKKLLSFYEPNGAGVFQISVFGQTNSRLRDFTSTSNGLGLGLFCVGPFIYPLEEISFAPHGVCKG